VFQHFLNFKAMVKKEKGVSIKCLRSDGGWRAPKFLVWPKEGPKSWICGIG
jgi:hypothetical protein